MIIVVITAKPASDIREILYAAAPWNLTMLFQIKTTKTVKMAKYANRRT